MKKIIASLFLILIILAPSTSFARDPGQIFDWYIKDFKTEIVVNKDSSLDITERIVADCGDLPDKHGIFRVLPTVFYTTEIDPSSQKSSVKKVPTPIQLIAITDFNGNPYKYQTIKDTQYNTLTWKIGDANITVTGENNYLIKYHVKNAIRFSNPEFDEFYWNLSGNFWDLEIDAFEANIIFPPEINQGNTSTYNYVGSYGVNNQESIEAIWTTPNNLNVKMKRGLDTREGVTTSVSFSKNIITPGQLTFLERNADNLPLLWLLIPFFVFLISLSLWTKYGKDMDLGRSIAPEFEIPDKMNPMEMGAFLHNGDLSSSYISASIVDLAVKGYLKIEEIPKKGFLSSADTKFIWAGKDMTDLTKAEQDLLAGLFEGDKEKLLSDLRNQFYKKIPTIKASIFSKLMEKNLFEKKGFGLRDTMFAIGGLLVLALFFGGAVIQAPPMFYVAIVISIIFLFFFGVFMPKRSKEGVDLLGRVKGFEMYMKTAEKYRQKFNEKENIFEKFLPYAMIFGIVGLWTKKMKEIYGEEYFNNHTPVWYVGSFHDGGFNVDNFSSQLNSLSSSMSSTMSSTPSSSGGGGGGFSGGGGGGGGGGGW